MVGHFDELIAVASGTTARVAGWCKLLRALKVEYVTAASCSMPGDVRPDHLELWVHRDDVDRVRSAFQEAARDDGVVLW
jgi:hypothetical protein